MLIEKLIFPPSHNFQPTEAKISAYSQPISMNQANAKKVPFSFALCGKTVLVEFCIARFNRG